MKDIFYKKVEIKIEHDVPEGEFWVHLKGSIALVFQNRSFIIHHWRLQDIDWYLQPLT